MESKTSWSNLWRRLRNICKVKVWILGKKYNVIEIVFALLAILIIALHVSGMINLLLIAKELLDLSFQIAIASLTMLLASIFLVIAVCAIALIVLGGIDFAKEIKQIFIKQ